jgi:hypothetical protein
MLEFSPGKEVPNLKEFGAGNAQFVKRVGPPGREALPVKSLQGNL